ncbi:hypothetical protein ACFWY9_30620 [Amycolatopsis sp. NPDC059027]|uniref:hypothetical protein n=1 Tax=Amycolatopsis sp. NPDC059027 TaxID=3346709 RepID=UPI00366F693E
MSFESEWEGSGVVTASEVDVVEARTGRQIRIIVNSKITAPVISFTDPATPTEANIYGFRDPTTGAMTMVVTVWDPANQAPAGGALTLTRNAATLAYYNNLGFPANRVIVTPTAVQTDQPVILSGEAWGHPSLFGGWSNRDGWDAIGFQKFADGRVCFRGSCEGGNVADGTKVFSLPEGYRPAGHDAVMPISAEGIGSGPPRLQVQSGGDAYIYGIGRGPIFLDSASFSTI